MNTQAIPGIGDNAITHSIEVIAKTEDWVEALDSGRDCTRKEQQTVETIQKKISRMAEHKMSPLYLATHIRRCEKARACLERQAKRNDMKRKEIRERRRQKKSCGVQEEESSDSNDSDSDQLQSDDEHELKDSILLDVLKAIARTRNE